MCGSCINPIPPIDLGVSSDPCKQGSSVYFYGKMGDVFLARVGKDSRLTGKFLDYPALELFCVW